MAAVLIWPSSGNLGHRIAKSGPLAQEQHLPTVQRLSPARKGMFREPRTASWSLLSRIVGVGETC